MCPTTTAASCKTLERDLKSVVFGQDKALECWPPRSRWRARAWARATSRSAPSCSAAPPGVGKTEAAKQLAYIMGIDLIRFDMSEYMERHA
jgi:ATP-dependent Clp protease ATP-binding subunit ClpA